MIEEKELHPNDRLSLLIGHGWADIDLEYALRFTYGTLTSGLATTLAQPTWVRSSKPA